MASGLLEGWTSGCRGHNLDHHLDRATNKQKTLMLATQKKRTQPVEQPPSASQAPISASNLPSGGSGGSTLRLRAVVLGAPRNSFRIEASPDDDINALQEKVKSVKPQRLGHLDPYELNLWKVVVVYSTVLFQAADNPHLISSNLQSYQRRLLLLLFWARTL